jgi:hypothetical protein
MKVHPQPVMRARQRSLCDATGARVRHGVMLVCVCVLVDLAQVSGVSSVCAVSLSCTALGALSLCAIRLHGESSSWKAPLHVLLG